MYAITTNSKAEPILPSFSNSVLLELFQAKPVENFSTGRAVFWEGDPAKDVFEVTRGILRLYRILPDGRRAIVGFVFAGEMMGLSFQDRYLFTAEAVGEVSVHRISRRMFHAAVDSSPHLRPELLSHLRDEMCAAQDQMLLVLRNSADERLASFLLLIARKTSGEPERGTEIQLAMARADIADYLGMSIETVSRSISRLKWQGIIALDGPSRLTIQRVRALRELAGEVERFGDEDIPHLAATMGRQPVQLAR